MNDHSIDLQSDHFIWCYYLFKKDRRIVKNIALLCIALIQKYLVYKILSISNKILNQIEWIKDGYFNNSFIKYARNSYNFTRLLVYDIYGKKHHVDVNLFGHKLYYESHYRKYIGDKNIYLNANQFLSNL